MFALSLHLEGRFYILQRAQWLVLLLVDTMEFCEFDLMILHDRFDCIKSFLSDAKKTNNSL